FSFSLRWLRSYFFSLPASLHISIPSNGGSSHSSDWAFLFCCWQSSSRWSGGFFSRLDSPLYLQLPFCWVFKASRCSLHSGGLLISKKPRTRLAFALQPGMWLVSLK